MNKQQLAAKIWESANQMRSKIEANEYKDYILGFIFYKYLSDKLEQFARDNDFEDEDILALSEDNPEAMGFLQTNLGYFIAHKHLFSTWLKEGTDLTVADVREALSAFSRLIDANHKSLFDGIFNTLQTGLSKLGSTTGEQSKAISNLLHLIKDIPTDGKQGYDVLGFIYEYLISMFAANAGKKAGEFYTPHEVSLLMSEIIAEHLKDRSQIDIYDPTSGSGSLLLNIGQAIAKHMPSTHNIKYYAQELKENTYNLTRMNLVMRGISPSNIVTRNADTLEDDWPFFEDHDPVNTYDTLYLDAVVSNPPYSQQWDPTDKDNDPRYARFGVAPKSKADYAFLLHDLYHLKADGIMAIVLPHGVLFRGGEEGQIRKNLIENNHIDAIIGLPGNIFFGTGIPTIIMVLKKTRTANDLLIVDASKGFTKEGKNNKLRACDIKKIVDVVTQRSSVERFSAVVSKETLRDNDYNLNIPRYVDSSEPAESWDLYASMFGGIPNRELDAFNTYWQAFPQLRESLFDDGGTPYSTPRVEDFAQAIAAHPSVQAQQNSFQQQFASLPKHLTSELIDKAETLNIHQQQEQLAQDIFTRLTSLPLIDKYQAYQLLADQWELIAADLEILQSEGMAAATVVEPHLVTKKVKGEDAEVQDGWKGKVLPFELVQQLFLTVQLAALTGLRTQLEQIPGELDELIESLSEDDGEYSVLNEANDRFVVAEINRALKEQLAELDSPELNALHKYITWLDTKASKQQKLDFITEHPCVNWHAMEANKDGTYGKGRVNAYINQLQQNHQFAEDSFGAKLVKASQLLAQDKQLKDQIKADEEALHLNTKTLLEAMDEQQREQALQAKWITPLVDQLHQLSEQPITRLAGKLQALADKYATTFADNARQIAETEQELAAMTAELVGNEFDMQGLAELQNLLLGKGR